ncbi:MAG TPA: type II secretion system protein [Solirubrobacteraceae bacterium]|nr:type II secretion system protein [Solirubrobacteraceae bacterium]
MRPLASERGDTLIEIVISSLIVGLIVVGTLTGFNTSDHVSAQEREHNEASTLADQSQQQLRTDPATLLVTLGSAGHSYTQTIGGTTYTIKQQAELLPASGSNASCSVTNTKRQSGNAFSITSTVTWFSQEHGNRKPVIASSVITPPTGSALEIDVDNAPVATSGVSGVTPLVTYTPVESSTPDTVQQTTGPEGCVVFGGIPATAATVEIKETPGYVTVSGASKYPTQEVPIAPNYTTHDEVIYNKAGAIEAEFAYEEKASYEHLNDEGTAKVKEAVTGDTFVAFNTKMKVSPEYEVGSTAYGTGSAGLFEPLTGTYAHTATSEQNLFPFTSSENSWGVFAGDCAEDNPETITSKVVPIQSNVVVNSGLTTTVKVPMSYVTLNVYKKTESEVNSLGSSKWKDLETTTSLPVVITSTKCTSNKPDNETTVTNRHAQSTTTGSSNGGHLTDPFQPFGNFTLCVYSSAEKKTYTFNEFTNSTVAGSTKNLYLPATSETGVTIKTNQFSNTC